MPKKPVRAGFYTFVCRFTPAARHKAKQVKKANKFHSIYNKMKETYGEQSILTGGL